MGVLCYDSKSISKDEKNIIFEKKYFKNIKSKYIIIILFDLLEEKKKLNILIYNKRLKNLLDIDIEYYKKNKW